MVIKEKQRNKRKFLNDRQVERTWQYFRQIGRRRGRQWIFEEMERMKETDEGAYQQ